VQSLESKLGREVVLDVIWTIKPTNRKDEASSKKNVVKAATINGRSRVTEKVSNEGFEALVEAQSKAFYKVSLDIAKAMQ
jgi:phosphoribosyl-ATP pyrophosphohydrolase